MKMRRALGAALAVVMVASGLVAASPAQAAVLKVDANATVSVTPGKTATAQFKKPVKLDKKRKVTLQGSADGMSWTKLSTATMSSKGSVEFGWMPGASTSKEWSYFRAVAETFPYKSGKKKVTAPAVATRTVKISWKRSFTDEFSGPTLDKTKWAPRLEGTYTAKGRQCSAPYASNSKVKGSNAELTVTKAAKARAAAANAAMKAKQRAANLSAFKRAEGAVANAKKSVDKAKKAVASANKIASKSKRNAAVKTAKSSLKKANSSLKKANTALQKLYSKKAPGCVNGVYNNAMVSTQDLVSFKPGIVAARIKFPKNQGMHASVWLQSGKQEIDMIESFGYGLGVSNVVHAAGKAIPAKDSARYVSKSATKSKGWWDRYHVFSVEWTTTQVIFRVDGVETRRVRTPNLGSDYFLVMSFLSSEYETARMSKPVKGAKGVKALGVKGASMKVDWVRAWVRA